MNCALGICIAGAVVRLVLTREVALSGAGEGRKSVVKEVEQPIERSFAGRPLLIVGTVDVEEILLLLLPLAAEDESVALGV